MHFQNTRAEIPPRRSRSSNANPAVAEAARVQAADASKNPPLLPPKN